MNPSRTAITFTVKAAREAAAMTVADIATATGIDPARLDSIEGQEQDASSTDLAAIATATGIGLDQLLSIAATIQQHIEDQDYMNKPINPDVARLKAHLQALPESDKAKLKADLQELHQVALKSAAYALASAAREQ
jgi:transcriptional regulator with XRE-family HTH domain